MIHKKGERLPAFFQALGVGDEPAAFQSEGEGLGGSLMPATENFLRWQTVERDVQFDRIKMVRIELKPFSLGKRSGIERIVPPMRIAVTARTDENHLLNERQPL